ncbi:MAG: hypothetical protein LBR35_00655 [Rickettsiales bacterium]|nr:hypothetical protein [Rickettsiales bacterium]
MNIEPEIFKDCNLSQACEWIAFKWKPMDKMFEEAIGRNRPDGALSNNRGLTLKRDYVNTEYQEYAKEIIKAKNLLKILLYKKEIVATGLPYYQIPNNATQLEMENLLVKMNKRIDITHFPINFELSTHNSQLHEEDSRFPSYTQVQINFEDLKKVFPAKKEPKLKSQLSYTTPYLDIMLEVIEEEKITNENQDKKDRLVGIIKSKMKELNLDESKNLANSMATLIRNPESQGGKNKKKSIKK